MRREIGGGHRRPPCPSTSAFSCPEKFRNFLLQEEYGTYDDGIAQLPLQWNKRKIIEIVAASDLIFVLAESGLCGAFSRTTNKHICHLKISPDEVIRSLFYNKNNDSLITVSLYESDCFVSLKCRTTPIEYIRRGQLHDGFPLFESESLKYPGFVEFDDFNGKVLTFSAHDSTYKVFDLKNYKFLYSICDKNIQDIKISPGIMLVIYQKATNHVPLMIVSIEDGTPLKTFTQLLHQNRKVDFIEQFNEKLLVKQDKENLQIIDVRNSDLIEVNKTEFMTPSAFIFLYENNLFLTFCNRTVAAWNFRGELVTSFDDHELWHPNCNTNSIYITADQDLIISYCTVSTDVTDDAEGGCGEAPAPMGSINMSNIFMGNCIAKISEILTDQTTCSSEMPEKTTSECKCQNYRGGTLAKRHVAHAAVAGGGRTCRREWWRHVRQLRPERRVVGPASTDCGGTLTWQHAATGCGGTLTWPDIPPGVSSKVAYQL